jgi:hypothetical protein
MLWLKVNRQGCGTRRGLAMSVVILYARSIPAVSSQDRVRVPDASDGGRAKAAIAVADTSNQG